MVLLKPKNMREFEKQIVSYRRNAVIFVGMHEDSEATGAIAEHVIDGKPLHDHFNEKAVFVQVPPKLTARGVLPRLGRVFLKQLKRLSKQGMKIDVSGKAISAEEVAFLAGLLHHYFTKAPVELTLWEKRMGWRSQFKYSYWDGLEEANPFFVEQLRRGGWDPKSFGLACNAIVKKLYRGLPSEEQMADSALKLLPEARVIIVHGTKKDLGGSRELGQHRIIGASQLFSTLRSRQAWQKVERANERSGRLFKLEQSMFIPGEHDFAFEFNVPMQAIDFSAFRPERRLLVANQIEGGVTQRDVGYLVKLKKSHPMARKYIRESAKAMKAFLEQYLTD